MDIWVKFGEIFGSVDDAKLFFAPGRVNLIGEHIDYNGGLVLPCVLSKGIYGIVRARSDAKVRFYAEGFAELGVIECDIAEDYFNHLHRQNESNLHSSFAKYPLAMLRLFAERGHFFAHGFELLLYSDLPIAAGLSSSHALLVLCGLVLSWLYDLPYDKSEKGLIALAKATKECENRYIGVNSGIMDGFAIALGKSGEAILLHCDTLDFSRIPLNLPQAELWIIDSGVTRRLAASEYNKRTEECAHALRQINDAGGGFSRLAEPDEAAWLKWQGAIEDDKLFRRARHVISENERVLQAVKALQQGDMVFFGKLLSASHTSLRFDYEVSSEALDSIAEFCALEQGFLGGRLTGAGFGGCFIALFADGYAEAALSRVATSYKERIGIDLRYFKHI